MNVARTAWLATLAATLGALLGWAAPTGATVPYTPVPVTAPTLGPGVVPPELVFGKEYSHDNDHEITAAGVSPDPQQIVRWDGIGGVTNGSDFTGTRPDWTPDQEIDAIANGNDALFRALLEDEAHLIFTHDDEITGFGPVGPVPLGVPGGGPVPLTNGEVIGGSGEVSIELAGAFAPPSTQGVWAMQSQVNAMPFPRDVDGLEVWGPEPDAPDDVDKYSLDLDFLSGVSIWNASGTPYLDHASVVSAVEMLLGPLMGTETSPYDNQEGENAINLDALMVWDRVGSPDEFDRDPNGAGEGDLVLFSIRQMIGTGGYYATGSELFLLDAAGGVGFLGHGGHVWDPGYAMGALGLAGVATQGEAVIDINGLEAIGAGVVPEPAGLAMLGLGGVAIVAMRRRLG